MSLWVVHRRGDGTKAVNFFNRANGKRWHCGTVGADTSTAKLADWVLRFALPGDVVRLDDGSHLVVQPARGTKA